MKSKTGKSRSETEKTYTYGDYCTWPDDERWEIIDGEAISMSPAPGTRHQDILGNLFFQFRRRFDGKECRVFIAPFDVRLPDSRECDDKLRTVVQPDLMVVCDPKKVDDKGVRGSPDLVVEIVSPHSARYDKVRKLNLYERHGVREFWVIDQDNSVAVFTLGSRKRYGRPEYFELPQTVESKIFPDLKIDLTKVLPPELKVVKERPAHYTVLYAPPRARQGSRSAKGLTEKK